MASKNAGTVLATPHIVFIPELYRAGGATHRYTNGTETKGLLQVASEGKLGHSDRKRMLGFL